MHSPARATALQCATSIFLIGNEFRFLVCAFRPSFFRPVAPLFGRFHPHFSTSRSPRLPFRGPRFSIFFGFGQGTASAVPKEMPRVILPVAHFIRANTVLASAGRGLSPDKRVLLILLPIVRLIRANGFGQHEFCHSLFDLSLAAASYVSQPSVSLLRSCQGTASAVPKDKTDAILPIARFTRANGFDLHGFGLDFCVRLSLFDFRSSNFVFPFCVSE